MRRTITLFALLLCFSAVSRAQIASGMSKSLYALPDFAKAIVTTKDGKLLTLPQANIFLKDGSLLYKKAKATMTASMGNIVSVEFDSVRYVRLGGMLAAVVDSIGKDLLLCTTTIDMDTYKTMLTNSREISNLEIGDMVSVTTIDLVNEEDRRYPLIKRYYYVVDGKTIEATERSVLPIVAKDKRRIFKALVESGDFNWGSPKSLVRLLKSVK